MTNKVYDVLKWVALVLLPALGTLYFAVSQIWYFPYGEEVVGTVVALELFLGTVLGVSNSTYKRSGAAYDGAIVVDTSGEDKDVFSIELDSDVDSIPTKESINLKVTPRSMN